MAPDRHHELTTRRAHAYAELFECRPSTVYSPHALFKTPDPKYVIDVLVYTLNTGTREIDVAVTNGMSDQRLIDPDNPAKCCRRELIQYFPKCTKDHARRLHDMAWLPLFDEFYLDCYHSIAWEYPAIAGTPWNNGFFLRPLIESHKKFVFEVEGDQASFLWHVPISDEERAFKQEQGTNALIDRMDAVNLPWVFDETNRPALVE